MKHSWHTAGSYFELSDLDDCGQLNPAKTMQRFNLCFMQYQWQQHIESCSPGSLWRAATVLPQRRAEVFSCLLSLFMPNPSADVKSGQSCHVQICEAKKVRAEAAVMEDVALGMEPRTCRDHFWHLGWDPQKHEIVSRICCMMHVCCGRQMSVKGNWIRQLQPVLNVVPMAVTATRWAVVIVVTPTGPLPPWPYAKHSWHTAGSYFELSDLDDCGQFTLAEPMPCFNLCLVQYQWQHHIKPWSLWLANWQAKNRLRAIESMDVSVPWQSLSDLVSHFGLNPCLGTGHAICFVTRFADSSQITFANAKHVFLTDKTTKTTTIKFCKNGSAVCCLHNRTILVHTNVGGPNFFGFPSPTSLILGSVGHTTLPRRKLQAKRSLFSFSWLFAVNGSANGKGQWKDFLSIR